MTCITVQRGNGDYPGDDITEPLLATVEAQLARGRAEIDEAESGDDITRTIAYDPDRSLGELLQVHDVWGDPAYRAKVTGIRHNVRIDTKGNPYIETQLTMRRPRASG